MSAQEFALSARIAPGLRYVDDRRPGIRRLRSGDGFSYVDPAGKPILDDATLSRIKALAVPPAYEDVWICPRADGHMQATGRDARGRKQYRYHARWRAVRDAAKFEHMLEFARVLPALRERVAADLALPGLPREKVLAAIVGLLETTLIRVGNEEYAKQNGSFGLTTLQNRHVVAGRSALQLRFRGKSAVRHAVDVNDRRLAAVVRRCRDLPGQDLFAYLDDDGNAVRVRSDDVNDYLREVTGRDITAKDFRTWSATGFCAVQLAQRPYAETKQQRTSATAETLSDVAARLGNTPAVCRKSYVHPGVLDAYWADGRLVLPRVRRGANTSPAALRDEERRVVAYLKHLAAA